MIYIVEDDENIRQMEGYALKNSGYSICEFGEAESFFAACSEKLPELVLLDIMLPGEDGFAILKRLRENAQTKKIPVIMVTAKATELDTVKALDSGADDYLVKPFGIMELISRVKAVLRRVQTDEITMLTFERIRMDDDRHMVFVEEKPCDLTYKEYELLKFFLQNQKIVLSREKIMDRVWGINFEGESRTVDMHIKTLRQKLGYWGKLIKTVRNVGYKIEE
ncbi:MAG: response regulator transcription factor [Ruminococcaceae bacterium]|nr:response regulator transcription factor [Oscillospiraceae bacterium]